VKVAGPLCRTAIGRRARVRAARPDRSTEGTRPWPNGIRWVGLDAARDEGRGAMSIVMGVDQHRAQITAEWIDVASAEISRARVRPADRGRLLITALV
jgi:hypothetical protein